MTTATSTEPQMKQHHDGSRSWWRNNVLHREDGPAVEMADGSRLWFRNGHCYKEERPRR